MLEYEIHNKLRAIYSWLRLNTNLPSWVYNTRSNDNSDIWDATGFIANLLKMSENTDRSPDFTIISSFIRELKDEVKRYLPGLPVVLLNL